MAHLKLSVKCLQTESGETCPNWSYKLMQVDFCTPLARIPGLFTNCNQGQHEGWQREIKKDKWISITHVHH